MFSVIWTLSLGNRVVVIAVQQLSRLFATPWTAAYQAPLSFTISLSLLKLMPIESVMPSNHLILCLPLLPLPLISPSIRVFSSESALPSGGQSIGASASASVLPMNIQGIIFQRDYSSYEKKKYFLLVTSLLWKLTYKVGFTYKCTLHTHPTPYTHTYACVHTHIYTHTGYVTIALHSPKVKQEGKDSS